MSVLSSMMSPLQWALLIFGVVAVIFIYLMTRRDKSVVPDRRGARVITQPRMEAPETYGIGGEFDEFGVSKPRKRGDGGAVKRSPNLNVDPTRPARLERRAPSVPPPFAPMPAPVAPAPEPAPVVTAAPPAAPVVSAPPVTQPVAPPAPPPVEEKIVTLLIARRDGTLQGGRLHKAMGVENLSYNPMQIYHRKTESGKRVFSVASLQKPGYLIPEEAAAFTTKGLSMFLLLPGPTEPVAAFEDMLRTAQRLAAQLSAEVYDGNRQVLSAQAIQNLRSEIKAWAAGPGAA